MDYTNNVRSENGRQGKGVVELSFQGVKNNDSSTFARAIHSSGIFEPPQNGRQRVSRKLSGVIVSFVGARFFEAWQLATVACIIRRLAEENIPVTIKWPGGGKREPTSIQKYLERLHFAQLFHSRIEIESWASRVSIDGRIAPPSYPPEPHETLRYVPLRWFTRKDFFLTGEDSDWKERPLVSPSVESDFRSIVLQQGFADTETIDILNRTMFLELGWNSVLHSADQPGSGIGIFCAQIRHDPNKESVLHFSIVDAGLGIPGTLHSAHEKAVQDRAYFDQMGKSLSSNIVRFALENYATSRPEFPSDIDRNASRGLALAAEVLIGRGSLTIRSGGGTVRVQGTSGTTLDFILDDAAVDHPIPGTQVVGSLRAQIPNDRITDSLPTAFQGIPLQLSLCCESDGRCPSLSSANAAKQFVDSINSTERILFFDLGYGDNNIRHLEYLCYNAIPRFSNTLLVFWNISVGWSQFGHLREWLCENLAPSQPPPLFIRELGDARVLGLSATSEGEKFKWESKELQGYANSLRTLQESTPDNQFAGFLPYPISADEYIPLAKKLNTFYLAAGFRQRKTESGFFTGEIHLLSTRKARRYFSISLNIAARGNSNLERWINGGIAAVTSILEARPNTTKPPIIIAFAGSMRHVLAHIPQRLATKVNAFTLLTYDIPGREEIGSYVTASDDVILLTDVITTGSLLSAVANAIADNNAHIIGVVSLVGNANEDLRKPGSIQIGRDEVKYVQIATFPHDEESNQLALADKEYWVDPVTLVPQLRKPWGWGTELDPRVPKTMDLLVASDAVMCGHIIDGARHSSIFVNTRRLMDADNGEVIQQVKSVLKSRLKFRSGWNTFAPELLLYPTGIRLIENVEIDGHKANMEGNPLAAYATAVNLFSKGLSTIWGERELVFGEVPRAFDPGGGARCSDTIFFNEPMMAKSSFHDVIIADDGMWKGATATALIRVAIAQGAKRILIVPLLARMNSRDIEFWETIHSLQPESHEETAEVCFIFPFVLPVPFYTAQECPYEVTQLRLRDRDWCSEMVKELAENLHTSLNGRWPGDAPQHTPLYTETWLKLRSYSELATDNEAALEKLGTIIEKLKFEDELAALFDLFLHEWRLLGKARLRQTIAPIVKERARRTLKSGEASYSQARIAAISLLRSQFLDDFMDSLEQVKEIAVRDLQLLSRVVLHIATLSPNHRTGRECISFLEFIQDHALSTARRSNLSDDHISLYVRLVSTSSALSLQRKITAEAERVTPREAAAQAMKLISNNATLKHDVRPFISRIVERGESLVELSAETFALHAKDWKGHHASFIEEHFIKLLEALRPCLIQMSAESKLNTSHIHYLTGSRKDSLQIAEDIAQIQSSLDFLAQGRQTKLFFTFLCEAASRLLLHVLREDSTFMSLLKLQSHISVKEFIYDFRDRITARLHSLFGSNSVADVSLFGFSEVDGNRKLFISSNVLEECMAHILHNLESKAFPFAHQNEATGVTEDKPCVSINISADRTPQHDPCLVVSVKNNGRYLKERVQLSAGGTRAARHIQFYGGDYRAPSALEEHPWRVEQRIIVCLW